MEPRTMEILRGGLLQSLARALSALATRLLVRDEPRSRETQEAAFEVLTPVDLPATETEASRPVERPSLLQPLVERCDPSPGQPRVDYFVTELATTRPSRFR
jgi:hypothetical protein